MSKSVEVLEQMLEELCMTWDLKQTVLYESIVSDEKSQLGVMMIQPLLQELKTDAVCDFSRENEKFRCILEK